MHFNLFFVPMISVQICMDVGLEEAALASDQRLGEPFYVGSLGITVAKNWAAGLFSYSYSKGSHGI
jgi:hypothetical protein